MNNRERESILIASCLKGDSKAQRSLYGLYAAKMYGICLRYVRRRHEAEDLLQEAMYSVYRDLAQYSGNGSFEGWIRRIVVNTALQEIRKKKIKFEEQELIESVHEIDNSHLMVFQRFENEDLLAQVQSLPDGCKIIFNLFVIEEYSHKEIAKKLDISIGTSKSQLSKARKILQTKTRNSEGNKNNE